MAKGGHRPGSGRPKGSICKATQDVLATAARLKCNPFEVMAWIVKGELPCSVCRGKGKTQYQPSRETRLIDGMRVLVVNAEGEAKLKERTCLSCYGSGKEIIAPELRGKMAGELANYLAPKRKAIEHTGSDGGPVQAAVTVKFVKAENAGSSS